MQKLATFKPYVEITPTAPIIVAQHGGRAKCLQRLRRLDMPLPKTFAFSFEAVHDIAAGRLPDLERLISQIGDAPLLSVRPSSEDPDWGGPGAILNIGMSDQRYEEMIARKGEAVASRLYLRFIQTWSSQVARLDEDIFEADAEPNRASIAAALRAYEAETDQEFPQEPAVQLAGVLRAMARAWESTSARLLRQGKGAPADAGLGLIVQEMALGVGPDESGSGVMQFIDPITGRAQITGRYLSQSQGRDALTDRAGAIFLTRDSRGPSLEDLCPEVFDELVAFGERCRTRLREEMQIEFVINAGQLAILDAVKVPRSSRANVSVAVAMAEDGIIERSDALMRIEPRSLNELLHPQVDPRRAVKSLFHAIGASPGAASGRIVFSSNRAQAMAARGEPCILVKRETTPEDVRGMHAARGVLTEKGGMSSHAAVIARGLGVPCIVGANEITLNRRGKSLKLKGGKILREGDMVTLDGSSGRLIEGAVDLLEPTTDSALVTLLSWADDVRDIGVRANADTVADARISRDFNAEGIGLCRTEHMFFEEDRLPMMREMIFADTAEARAEALRQLLPMQRSDFGRLFEIMEGRPVCIRLFDPPLHEFLPNDRAGMLELAAALGKPLAEVQRRVEAQQEYNPMLGLRGVRLGITLPEIYDMQARAIFEAALEAESRGLEVVPEIMIPLVSARREVEVVRAHIEKVAAAVRAESGVDIDYKLGVMVETPRAALKADQIAEHSSFLSFGTNDLTQMTYGLSRDDAGRFMGSYVRQGVFDEDPFQYLDREGVGELLKLGAARGRSSAPGITLSLCGEHGGNSESIAFCREVGFDYVSCSPFRVPVARLAAARAALISADG